MNILSRDKRTLNWDFRAEDYGDDGPAALEAARRTRAEVGRDEYGRVPTIYAVTPSGLTVFVE